jgi:hypothetical protein
MAGIRIFKEKQIYLMFTNRKLYTLNAKAYEEGIKDREKLVRNKIDISYLSHLIFLPEFAFETYEHLNTESWDQQSKQHFISEFETKKVDLIIGFNMGDGSFNESDLALSTNVFNML